MYCKIFFQFFKYCLSKSIYKNYTFNYQEKYDIRFKFTNLSKRNCQHDNHATLLYAIEYNIIQMYYIHIIL